MARYCAAAFLAITAMLIATAVCAEDPNSIVGTWLTEGGSGKIKIYKCGGKYCGKTIWISRKVHPNPEEKRDIHNPDPKKRDRKVVGQTVLKGLTYNQEGKIYEDGAIYDPDRGKTFSCKAWLKDGGKILQFRGFLGISLLGKTTTWTRVR